MKRRISRQFRPTMSPVLDQLESRQLLSTGFQVVPSVSGLGCDRASAIDYATFLGFFFPEPA